MEGNPCRLEEGNDRSNPIKKLISEIENEKPHQFSHEQLMSITSDLRSKIGSGGFGDVYKGYLPPNGKKVAVKVLKDNQMDKKIRDKQFMAEFSTMGRTYHQNLVKLCGFCVDGNMKALVYEYLENGSLDNILFQKNSIIEWAKLYDIATDTARGLSYLHESCHPQIIHHDIKADNVLLDSNFSPKITDFGLARLINRDLSHVSQIGFRGTRGYAAPEVCFGWKDITTHKCDVYSFGMLLFEVLRRKRIWDDDDDQEWFPVQVWTNLKNGGQLKQIITKCGIEDKDIEKANRLSLVALLCAQHIPHKRPVMSIVVKMLEGEIEPSLPLEPFPYYDFSSTESSSRSISEVPPTIAESLYERRFSYKKSSNQEEGRRHSEVPLSSKPVTESELLLAKFRKVYPPEGEDCVIVYTASKGRSGNIEFSEAVVSMLEYHQVHFAAHDASKRRSYMSELQTILGKKTPVELPHLFVKGRSIDAYEFFDLGKEGKLEILLDGIPKLQKQPE